MRPSCRMLRLSWVTLSAALSDVGRGCANVARRIVPVTRIAVSLAGPEVSGAPPRDLASLDHPFELFAQNPGQAEEPDQHHQAQTGRGIVHELLRQVTEGIASRNDGT